MSVSTYVQSTFDKALVLAIRHLKKEQKLKKQSEFAKAVGLIPVHMTEIMQAKRGVPEHKRSLARYILVNDYKVRPEFLDTSKGPILVQDDMEFNALRKENDALKLKVTELTQMLDAQKVIEKTQRELIDSLKAQLSKPGQKGSQKK